MGKSACRVRMIHYPHMDVFPSSFQPETSLSETPAPAVSVGIGQMSRPREAFTMTVDHVATELALHGFRRDARTIQRWCKSGRLLAVIEHDHGDRYLIDPSSVRAMVAMLQKEEALRAPLSRPVGDPAPAAADIGPDVAPTFRSGPEFRGDFSRHDATHGATQDAMPRPGRGDVAMLTAHIAELERENVMLAADKQVREQMVGYLKEEFTKMLDQAMTSVEALGQLRAENRYLTAENANLRAALPAPTREPSFMAPTAEQDQPFRFSPRSVMQRDDFVPPTPPVHKEAEVPDWRGV